MKPRSAPPYQHWNKNYWLDYNGDPHFAETALLQILMAAGWNCRWTTWTSGKPTFRTAPMVGAKSHVTGVAADRYAIVSEAKAAREQELAKAGWDLKLLRGGSWDVIAWKEDDVVFIETKQLAQSWNDAIRASQRLWLEAATGSGMRADNFFVLE